MAEKPVRGDKLWRSSALIILCGLVYYFSYDQGRQTVETQFESYKLEALAATEIQRREILRLTSVLEECRAGGARVAEGNGAAERSGETERSGATPTTASPFDSISLRTNQSYSLFDDRLVVTLLKVESSENKAILQMNFLMDERILTGELRTGTSFKFSFDGRNWALLLKSLTLSTARLSLVELTE